MMPSAAMAGAVLSALLLLAPVAPALAQRDAQPKGEVLEGPARVIDGDTLVVGGTKIRLYAVDAPEKSQLCKDAKGADYACGEKSLEALKDRVGGGSVRCTVRTKDQYGRSVASCTLPPRGNAPSEEDMGEWLVKNGQAVSYKKIARDYEGVEEVAKAGKRGIWQGSFENPAKWRYEQRMEEQDGGGHQRPLSRSQSAPARLTTPRPAQQAAAPAPVADGRSYATAAGAGASAAAPAATTTAAAAPQQQQPAAQPQQQRGSYAAAAGRGLTPPNPGCDIKGNIGRSGSKIYHTTKSGAYDKVVAEQWFCTEAEAQAAGFRAAGAKR